MPISPSPTFDLAAFASQWFAWSRIERCFWPRSFNSGRSAKGVDPELAPVASIGGVYLLAWTSSAPTTTSPLEAAVEYIGETGNFRERLNGFGAPAGFWGDPYNGHSAGWRWNRGNRRLWVALFPISSAHGKHIEIGLRKWYEAVALHEYRAAHGGYPRVNQRAGLRD